MTLGDAVPSEKPKEAKDHFESLAEKEMNEIMNMNPYDNDTSEIFKDYMPAGNDKTDVKR